MRPTSLDFSKFFFSPLLFLLSELFAAVAELLLGLLPVQFQSPVIETGHHYLRVAKCKLRNFCSEIFTNISKHFGDFGACFKGDDLRSGTETNTRHVRHAFITATCSTNKGGCCLTLLYSEKSNLGFSIP